MATVIRKACTPEGLFRQWPAHRHGDHQGHADQGRSAVLATLFTVQYGLGVPTGQPPEGGVEELDRGCDLPDGWTQIAPKAAKAMRT